MTGAISPLPALANGSQRFPDPQHSRAILIGSGSYTRRPFREVPTVEPSLRYFEELLTSEDSWNLAREHCRVLTGGPDGLLDRKLVLESIEEVAGEVSDTLFVMYAGHATPTGTDLVWVLPGERSEAAPVEWGVRVSDVASSLDRGMADRTGIRRVIVLDCCFSGTALGMLSDDAAPTSTLTTAARRFDQVKEHYFLGAADRGEQADAGMREEYTGFTTSVAATVRAYRANKDEIPLSLDEFSRRVSIDLRGRRLPVPVPDALGGAGSLPLLHHGVPRTGHDQLAVGFRITVTRLLNCRRGNAPTDALEHPEAFLRIEREFLASTLPPRDKDWSDLNGRQNDGGGRSLSSVLAVLGILPRDTDIPLCLLVVWWRLSGHAAEKIRTMLYDLALVCRAVGRSGAGNATADTLVLSMDPAKLAAVSLDSPTAVAAHAFLVQAATTLLPEGHRASGPDWCALPTDMASCGGEYLWRHLVRHLIGSGETAAAAELAADPSWIRAKIMHFGHSGPTLDDLRRTHPPGSAIQTRLSQVAHLLRAEDGPGAVDEVLVVRAGLSLPARAPAPLSLLQCADEEPAEVVRVLDGRHGTVDAMSVLADGSKVLTVGADRAMRCFDPTTGEVLAERTEALFPFTDCALLPGGSHAVTIRADGLAQLWDVRDLATPLGEAEDPPAGGFRHCVGVDDRLVACTGKTDRSVHLLRINGLGRDPARLRLEPTDRSGLVSVRRLRHRRQVVGCVAAPDGQALLVATSDGLLHHWPLKGPLGAGGTGTPGKPAGGEANGPLHRLNTLNEAGTDSTETAGCTAAGLPDGDMLVMVFGRYPDMATPLRWRPDLGPGPEPAPESLGAFRPPIPLPEAVFRSMTSAALAPQQHLMAVTDRRMRTSLLPLSVDDGACFPADPTLSTLPTAVGTRGSAFIPGDDRRPWLLTAGADGRTRIWDAAACLTQNGGAPFAESIGCGSADDGRAVFRADGSVGLFAADSPEESRFLELSPSAGPRTRILTGAFGGWSAGTGWVLLGGEDGSLRILRPDRSALVRHGAGRRAVAAAVASPDGRLAVTVSREGEMTFLLAGDGFEPTPGPILEGRPVGACIQGSTGNLFVATARSIHWLKLPPSGDERTVAVVAAAEDPAILFRADMGRHSRNVTAVCGGTSLDPSVFAAAGPDIYKIVVEETVRHLRSERVVEDADITALAVDPTGRHLAAVDTGGLVRILDTRTLRVRARHRLNGRLNGCAWGVGGLLLVSSALGLAHLRMAGAHDSRQTSPTLSGDRTVHS
ncbi:hypothetical protein OG900_31955 [Streptomyces sp. NBC_00433]